MKCNVSPGARRRSATRPSTKARPLTFTATATDPDLPANTLTFSLERRCRPAPRIDASTGVFTWTPTEAQGPGSYTFDVVVSDGALTDSETITITVSEGERRPGARCRSATRPSTKARR